ncbi:hypothetical protein SAMD00023353_1000590 [Rosellinia necatrix]|uniref:Uncharacterized protein n=1 Tax=Rosellinia necatrix TaxID=77044 RepID=A0A1W2TBX7_ROSNE|nr:hypothetical protein SAMD00023353_1000590 [Rosellinia necatrix]
MTDSADNRPSTADHPPDTQHARTPPPFAPVFTLINNASTGTTHHPHVRYVFSDDDPDVLTRSLAECEHTYADESSSGSAPANRAMILDLAPNDDGNYSVAWASSLSPSWAVLNAELSQISPPSSDAGHNSDSGAGDASTNKNSRPDRLMLRIEGIETSAPSSSSEMRISDEASRHRPTSASGSGSGQRERERAGEGDDQANTLEEFERRMATLRKVVNAGEERRKKVALETIGGEDAAAQDAAAENPATST